MRSVALAVALCAASVAVAPLAGAASEVTVFLDERPRAIPHGLGEGMLPSAEGALWAMFASAHELFSDIRVGTPRDACEAMRAGPAGGFVTVKLRWVNATIPGYSNQVPAAQVKTTVWEVVDSACKQVATQFVRESPRTILTNDRRFHYLPDRELTEALSDALVRPRSITAVLPTHAVDVPAAEVEIPVVLAGDDEYRERYGEFWREKATQRVDFANRFLTGTGLELAVRGTIDWVSPDEERGAAAVAMSLRELSEHVAEGVVIGFSGQTGLEHQAFEDKLLGLAEPGLGRSVLLSDAAIFATDDPSWDRAAEGITLVHELFHNLGAGHQRAPGWLMSSYSSYTRSISPEFLRLVFATARLRFGDELPADALEHYLEASKRTFRSPEEVEAALLGSLPWLDARAGSRDWTSHTCLGPRSHALMAWYRATAAIYAPGAEARRAAWVRDAHRHAEAASLDPRTAPSVAELLDPRSEIGAALGARRAELGDLVSGPDPAGPACLLPAPGSG